jgi:hypothetical protein
LRSRLRHCRRYVFVRSSHDASIFLCPLAPPALPGFTATMDTLTPVRWLFVPVGSPAGIRHMNTILFRTGLSASRIWPSEHPIPNHSSDPSAAFTHNPSARWASSPGYVETDARNSERSLGFAITSQARRTDKPKRVRLSIYGLFLHLLLLPTPPRGDAVTFGYRPECVYLKRTCTSPTRYVHRRTRLDFQVRPPRTRPSRSGTSETLVLRRTSVSLVQQ